MHAGPFEAKTDSFRLHLAAEGKAPRTLRNYTEAVRWIAAAHLLTETGKTSWEQAGQQDAERWAVRILEQYSVSYAANQVRAVRRFLRWLAFEEDRPDPVRGLRAPATVPALVPVFTSEELSALRRGARAVASRPTATPRPSRCSWRPASAAWKSPRSATTPATRPVAT